jgi:K+-sensing histidine kinase KdpD
MNVLQDLIKQFPLKNGPLPIFSRLEKALQKHLDLAQASLLFRSEKGFKSFSNLENPAQSTGEQAEPTQSQRVRKKVLGPGKVMEIPEKSPLFENLIRKQKPICEGGNGKNGGSRNIFWPVVFQQECVACYALTPKSKGSKLKGDGERVIQLLSDWTALFLREKKLWEELENTNREALFGWMSAAMVHEIRNPLTALSTLIQLLPQKRKDEQFMDSFEKLMKREVERLYDLTVDLLHFSKTSTEKMKVIDLQSVIQPVMQLMRPLFNSKKVELKAKPAKSMFLLGNGDQLEGLLINLLQNGMKAAGTQGIVEIAAGFSPRSPQGPNWLKIQVKDNGPGISREDLPKIFKPFFSTDRSGTGLGLAICQKVVENHKGYMKVKSLPGKGTVFTVCLPGLTSQSIKNLHN